MQAPADPDRLQAKQGSWQGLTQQTPSAQLSPLKQSLVAVQTCPRRFFVPQRFVWTSQMPGERQSASTVHAALQAVAPLQTYGAQAIVVAA